MFKSNLFGNRIEPACEYCLNGRLSANGTILCKYKGIVEPYFNCKKFIYAPLKREPKVAPKMPIYTEDDFKL